MYYCKWKSYLGHKCHLTKSVGCLHGLYEISEFGHVRICVLLSEWGRFLFKMYTIKQIKW